MNEPREKAPPSIDVMSPRPSEISLEGLLLMDLNAWTAAKEAIKRAASSSSSPGPAAER
jgi:hypothetical protein